MKLLRVLTVCGYHQVKIENTVKAGEVSLPELLFLVASRSLAISCVGKFKAKIRALGLNFSIDNE